MRTPCGCVIQHRARYQDQRLGFLTCQTLGIDRRFTMIQRRSSPSVRSGEPFRSWTMQGPGVDHRRSTVDLDFTCFNSMAGRNSRRKSVKLPQSQPALSFAQRPIEQRALLCLFARLARNSRRLARSNRAAQRSVWYRHGYRPGRRAAVAIGTINDDGAGSQDCHERGWRFCAR
jgi:hypothetical protein